MSHARDQILARIASIPRSLPAPVPRLYRQSGDRSAAGRVDLFCERVADYRAEVVRTPAERVAEVVDTAFADRGANRIAIPAGVPAAWWPRQPRVVVDEGLTASELETFDGVVTSCTVAVAETGTVILTGGPAEGRRVLTLVPDLHVCVIEAAQVVELVPEALRRIAALVGSERRPVTMISGPSATSDIELSRVEGVHGPRTLVVVVVDQGPLAPNPKSR